MKIQRVILAIIIVFQLYNTSFAIQRTSYDAKLVVNGWLKADSRPLDMEIGSQISKVETFINNNGEVVYYIVYLQPTGFVVVSANDLVEPIIGFVDSSVYDPSAENPLTALITSDINRRIASFSTYNTNQSNTASQNKWDYYISLSLEYSGSILLSNESVFNVSPSDIRVGPLLTSEWNQKNIFEPYERSCFNYYTPQILSDGELSWDKGEQYFGNINNYPAGGIATAIAQLMKYYEYPNNPVQPEFDDPNDRVSIGIRDSSGLFIPVYENIWRALLGGDEIGGQYKWNLMVNDPNQENTTIEEIKAIAALCHDAGVASKMNYTESCSVADIANARLALLDNFQYSNAVLGGDKRNNIGHGLVGMTLPNLDAGKPVIVSIFSENQSYVAVCDGYGFDSSGTLYHHLNMGWSDVDDCWYNLPIADSSISDYGYSTIVSCIYNIFEETQGEIISGRVLDCMGEPADSNTVYLEYEGIIVDSAITNSNGIFAFDDVNSLTKYILWVGSRNFQEQEVITGNSRDNFFVSGNIWSVDFPSTKKILYVDQSATTGQNDGSSWNDAFVDLQDALETASICPGQYNEIWVASGIYKPDRETSDPNMSFHLIDCVSLYGGFAGNETSRQQRNPNDNVTILSGDINDDNEPSGNSYHVVNGSNTGTATIISGFTIADGNACGDNSNAYGGGMYIYKAFPIIEDCIFAKNSAKYGGGLFNNISSVELINCTFSDNSADSGGGLFVETGYSELTDCVFINNDVNSYGGGIYSQNDSNSILNNCVFDKNTAHLGGGLFNYYSNARLIDCTFNENNAYSGCGLFNEASSPELKGCLFTGNTYTGNPDEQKGGAIRNQNNSNPTFVSCEFKNNSSIYGGVCFNTNSNPVFTNCIFNSNNADISGGGVFNHNSDSDLTNCILCENTAQYGGGFLNNEFSNLFLQNCNVLKNRATGGALYNYTYSITDITNCILGCNDTFQMVDDTGGFGYTQISYSNIAMSGSNVYPGIGNINEDPLFVDFDNMDYHLQEYSPCIDAGFGDCGDTIPDTDIEGKLRFDNPTTVNTGSGTPDYVDMGAFEYYQN